MSASLVGSEMCIRDRSSTMAATLPPSTRSWSSTPTDRDHRSPATTKDWSVSYTHLTLPTICSV
eukprot:7292112-Alexandrium_andersonii.AAC.1